MNFLCHAGPWSNEYLQFLIDEIDERNVTTIISGHKKIDKSSLVFLYYKNLSVYERTDYECDEVDLDIIKRCRLLRTLKIENATKHLLCMRKAVSDVYEACKPDIVISETIDSFIMDLLYFEAKKRSVPFVGLVTVFVNGYFRISARGEFVKMRDPSSQEVESVLKMLTERAYKPRFLKNEKKYVVRDVTIKWIRNIIKIPYFIVKRCVSGDYYNYHYWMSFVVSKQWFNLFPRYFIGDKLWVKKISNINKLKVFVPLQMFPEATIDYWCDRNDVIDYESILVRFIMKHRDMHFVIKEHPNVIGFRNVSLYKKLKSINNVTLVPTEQIASFINDYVDAVLVWTGTVGFESALRQVPLLCFSKPYYFKDNFRCHIVVDENTESDEIIRYVRLFGENHGYEKPVELVNHLVSGIDRGNLLFDGSWDRNNQQHIEDALVVAKSLKRYIDILKV